MPQDAAPHNPTDRRSLRAEYHSRQSLRRSVRTLCFLLSGGLVLLLAVSHVPLVARWEALFNRAFALWANRLLIGNVVGEWTFALVLHEVGQTILWGILIVCAGRAILQRRDGFRILGYVLWAFVWSTIAFQIADKVGDVIELDSPNEVLADIEPLADVLGGEFAGDEADDFPDDHTVAFSCGLLLLMLRLPRAMLPALLLPLLTWIGMILDGRAWVIHHTLSASIGVCIGSFAHAFMGKTLRPLEHWAERTASRFATRAPKWLRPTKPDLDAHAVIEVKRARNRRSEIMWNRLVHRELAPFLKPATQARLLPHPPRTPDEADPRAKSSRYVRFLQMEGYPTVVIKAAWKRFGVFRRGRRITRYESAARKHLTLDQMGLRVPRILWQSSGITGPTFDRFCMIVEEFVSSRPTDTQREDDLRQIAGALALMHSHRSPTWGELGVEGSPARNYATGRLRGQVHHAMRAPGLPGGSSWVSDLEEVCWRKMTGRLHAHLEKVESPFALVHGDAGTQNFRFQEDRLVLLDFLTVGFDLPGPEILQAALRFGGVEPAGFLRFWKTYFREAGEAAWTDFLSHAGVACSLFFLHELGHGRAAAPLAQAKDAPLAAQTVENLLQLPRSTFGDRPEDTDAKRLLSALKLASSPANT